MLSSSAFRSRLAVVLIALAGAAILLVGLRPTAALRDKAADPPLPNNEGTVPRR